MKEQNFQTPGRYHIITSTEPTAPEQLGSLQVRLPTTNNLRDFIDFIFARIPDLYKDEVLPARKLTDTLEWLQSYPTHRDAQDCVLYWGPWGALLVSRPYVKDQHGHAHGRLHLRYEPAVSPLVERCQLYLGEGEPRRLLRLDLLRRLRFTRRYWTGSAEAEHLYQLMLHRLPAFRLQVALDSERVKEASGTTAQGVRAEVTTGLPPRLLLSDPEVPEIRNIPVEIEVDLHASKEDVSLILHSPDLADILEQEREKGLKFLLDLCKDRRIAAFYSLTPIENPS